MGEYQLDLPAAAALLVHTDMDGLMQSPTDLAGYRLLNRRDGEDEFREEWRDGAAAVELLLGRRKVEGGAEGWGDARLNRHGGDDERRGGGSGPSVNGRHKFFFFTGCLFS
jgi:hypothetical protein